jgi:hypothetical protein
MRLTKHPTRFQLALIGLTLTALAGSFSLATPVLAGISGAANQPADGGMVGYGTTVTGSINDDNPEDRWQFQAAANDVVTIIMDCTGGPLDPYLQLLGPGGNEVTWDDDSGGGLNARITGFRLLEAGTYTIVATRYPANSGGDYSLRLYEGLPAAGISSLPGYEESVTGSLNSAQYEHLWDFQGHAGDIITLDLTRTSGDLDPYLRLFGPDGELLARDDDNDDSTDATITYTLPATGQYLAQATRYAGQQGTSSGTYQLALRLGTPETGSTGGGAIGFGLTVTGTLSDADFSDAWTFQGTLGESVTISMAALDGSLDTLLELIDPSGQPVASDDDGGDGTNSLIVDFVLQSTGTYTILAQRFGGIGGITSGSYALGLQQGEASPQAGGMVAPGQMVSGTINDSNPADRWTFEGSFGDVITISMETTDGGLDSFLQLVDPTGNIALADDDSGNGFNALIDRYTLQSTGTYTIFAQRFGGADGQSSGGYQLRLLAASSGGGGSIAYGQIGTGSLDDGNTEDLWTFVGAAGDSVTIALDATSGSLDASLDLLDPGGNVIAHDDDSGGGFNPLIDGFQLPGDDGYTIVARRFGDAAGSTSGSYQLSLRAATTSGGGTIQYGQAVGGTLNDSRYEDRWTFQGIAGDVLTIRMDATGGTLDPFLELIDPRGQVIAFDDDGGGDFNSLIGGYTLPETGSYTIAARRFGGPDGVTSGSYHLTLNR